MFDKEYAFRGKHAEAVLKLTAKLDDKINRGLFKTNYDIYAIAPLIGVLYKRLAPLDKSEPTTKVFRDKMLDENSQLMFNYRLIMMILDRENKVIDERMEIAFKMDTKDEVRAQYDVLYDDYVRGGVEVLVEHTFSTGKTSDEYIMNFYEFLSEFNSRYYSTIEIDK